MVDHFANENDYFYLIKRTSLLEHLRFEPWMTNLNDVAIRIVIRRPVLVRVHVAGARTDEVVNLIQLGDPCSGS